MKKQKRRKHGLFFIGESAKPGHSETSRELRRVELAAENVRLNFPEIVPINGFDTRIDRVDQPTR
jgi:hypothetical protein